jgi:hypothetical protein
LRAAAQASEKAKLEALERSLGITRPDTAASTSETTDGETGKKRQAGDVARKKHRFEDTGFFEESREINDGVRSAVAAGKSTRVQLRRSARGRREYVEAYKA